jgi:hypothetical protein
MGELGNELDFLTISKIKDEVNVNGGKAVLLPCGGFFLYNRSDNVPGV